jgi:hypothetical protein
MKADIAQVAFQIAGMLFKLEEDERSDALERVDVLLRGFGDEEEEEPEPAPKRGTSLFSRRLLR